MSSLPECPPNEGQLREVRTEPDPTVISHCESLLHYARTGELKGLLWVAVWPEATCNSGWVLRKGSPKMRMVGEVESCKMQLLMAVDDDVRDMLREVLESDC